MRSRKLIRVWRIRFLTSLLNSAECSRAEREARTSFHRRKQCAGSFLETFGRKVKKAAQTSPIFGRNPAAYNQP